VDANADGVDTGPFGITVTAPGTTRKNRHPCHSPLPRPKQHTPSPRRSRSRSPRDQGERTGRFTLQVSNTGVGPPVAVNLTIGGVGGPTGPTTPTPRPPLFRGPGLGRVDEPRRAVVAANLVEGNETSDSALEDPTTVLRSSRPVLTASEYHRHRTAGKRHRHREPTRRGQVGPPRDVHIHRSANPQADGRSPDGQLPLTGTAANGRTTSASLVRHHPGQNKLSITLTSPRSLGQNMLEGRRTVTVTVTGTAQYNRGRAPATVDHSRTPRRMTTVTVDGSNTRGGHRRGRGWPTRSQ